MEKKLHKLIRDFLEAGWQGGQQPDGSICFERTSQPPVFSPMVKRQLKEIGPGSPRRVTVRIKKW